MAFPDDLPVIDSFSTPITLQALQHTQRHTRDRADIVGMAALLGTTGSSVQTSHTYKLSTVTGASKAETQANKDTDTTLAENSDTKYPSQKAIKAYVDAAVAAALAARELPVGSIYVNATNSNNPATVLGYGTWSAFGAGRVMVGLDSGQTEFDTAEETGGAKTHTLTTAEIPSHHHAQNVTALTGGPGLRNDYDGDAAGISFPQGIDTGSTGGGGAHNNLQPYIVVYMWKRTA